MDVEKRGASCVGNNITDTAENSVNGPQKLRTRLQSWLKGKVLSTQAWRLVFNPWNPNTDRESPQESVISILYIKPIKMTAIC